jgi:hypothetical protein
MSTTQSPPVVPLRHSGWPRRRMPLWTLLVAVVLVAAGVLVSLSRTPSTAQQVSDFNSYLRDMNAAVESCAGGVTESRQAMDAVTPSTRTTALSLVAYDANNCSPANNEPLQDLTQYQVTESLAKFDLADCANDYITWSFDAAQTQLDMVSVIKAGPLARPAAEQALARAEHTMDAERATIDGILRSAEHTLSDRTALPHLPA